MEPMEIDCIVDVPDTPDRLTTRHDDQKYVGNPLKRERTFPVADEMKGNLIILSPQEKSHPSQNAPIFRRAQTEKFMEHRTTYSNGAEKMEKEKAVSSKFSARPSNSGLISVLDLTEEKGQSRQLKPAFSHRGSRDNATKDHGELSSNGTTSLHFIADSSSTSRNETLAGPNTSVGRGKSIALSNNSQPQLETEKHVSLPPRIFSTSRGGGGQKRLVRNGCISPHNIAARAKQAAEQSNHQTSNVEHHTRDLVSSNTMPIISVEDIVAEERGINRMKGKQVLVHPSSCGQNTGTIHIDSSPVVDYEEVNTTGNAVRASLKYSGGQGGWRTTHNSDNNTDQHLYDVNEHTIRRNSNVGRFDSRLSSRDVRGSLLDHAAQASSPSFSEADRLTATCPTTSTLTKRQKKRGLTSANPNEASLNSRVIFLGSSGESSSSSHSPDLDPKVIDLLPEPRSTNDSSSSDARARQVEADEMLARELQEQLYHDDFEGTGIDEHLAWELQQEDLMHTAVDDHHLSHSIRYPRENNQPRSRPYQNPSNRRRAVPQVPFSNRMSQLRNRTVSRARTSTVASRGRRPRFPVDMDLSRRLDILEALDLMDMGVANDIFHAQHDFDEDDYEMLLALDEENHQHTGATSNQINSLPESTIQTDNFTEACAVCLEIPVKGEIIRHLPCLHKFHKHCIDRWLQRKTSCPVCKSSIT